MEAAGGQILFWNGVRVMGLLAVSRAIGDHSLRPYVIAEPEVSLVAGQPAGWLAGAPCPNAAGPCSTRTPGAAGADTAC